MKLEGRPGPFHAPPRASFRQKLGPGGASSLVLALASAGLLWPLVARVREVLRQRVGDLPRPADLILVLGRRLEAGRPTAVFEARLRWGAELWRGGFAPRVVVAGGTTGRATLSEAEAGRDWLMAEGLPASAILLEDHSQHTLENLFYVRALMAEQGWRELLLVSDPLHTARARAMADGLRLYPRCSPAQAAPPRPGRPAWCLRLLSEAFLLHWYRTGLAWSRLIASKRQLERVT